MPHKNGRDLSYLTLMFKKRWIQIPGKKSTHLKMQLSPKKNAFNVIAIGNTNQCILIAF